MNDVQMLARYKAWADERFLSAVSALPAAELVAPQPIVFGSLIRTLHHVCAMDHVWQCHLLGKPHGHTSRNPEQCPGMAKLARTQHDIDSWYIDYADAMTVRQASETIEFEFIGGGRGAMTRSDILLHVVNHTTYHRGHAAEMLYHFGVFPPATDLPVFLREHSNSDRPCDRAV